MRRSGIGAIVGLAMVVAALTLQAAPTPVAFTGPRDIRRFVRATRLIRPVVVDDGALRLDPPNSTPVVSEARALEIWESRGAPGGYSGAPDVVIFLSAVTASSNLHPSPGRVAAPRFYKRLAWVFMSDVGTHSCPILINQVPLPPRASRNTPPNRQIEMIAADDSGLGIRYETRGTFCGEAPHGPTAEASTYSLLVPWRIVSASPKRCIKNKNPCLLVQHFKVKFVVPPCARESVVSLRESTIDIAVEIPMSGHCYSAAHTETMEATVGVSRGSPVPSYIGLVRGTARSGPDFLDYFDGVEHTTRL